jgi:hypothetical protein
MIGWHATDDLNVIEIGTMKNRAATYPINCDAIDKVRLPIALRGAYRASEKTQRILLDSGVSQPADVKPDTARLIHWQQCYGDLWKLKLAFEKKYNRWVVQVIDVDHPILVLEESEASFVPNTNWLLPLIRVAYDMRRRGNSTPCCVVVLEREKSVP